MAHIYVKSTDVTHTHQLKIMRNIIYRHYFGVY